MCENLSNLTELNYLWKRRGNKNYNLISMISCGNFTRYMMLDDRQNSRKVVGKIVTLPKEGEAYHWPRLFHENLVPLLEIVAINEATSVYIFPSVGSCLKNVIHDDNFRNDLDCFDRKKAYAGDILWALDYLHRRSLCIMNLTETIIYIDDVADKAVICDFSCVVLIQRASKDNVQLPSLYQAPEINTEYFHPVRFETWACGVMLLQVFSQHRLPSIFIGKEVHSVLQAVTEINYDTFKEANPGSSLCQSDIESLKTFLGLFLAEDPDQRVDVQLAAISSFLKHTKRKSVNEDASLKKRVVETNTEAFRSFKISEREHDYLIKSTTFKDIYQKEATKYKKKLRRSLSTNKFINLDYVPNCTEEKNTIENEYGKKESCRDIKANETPTDSMLSIKNNSKESVISKNKKINPELFKNEFHNLYSKSVEVNKNTSLKQLQKNSEDRHTDARECYLDVERLGEDVIDINCNQFAPGAKYNNKLMQLSPTNKSINLEYDPNFTEEKISAEKIDEKESSRNITHVTAHETSTEFVLPIKNNSKESVIGDKKENTPEIFQNKFHILNSKSVEANNNISLELLQNNSKDGVNSTFQNWHIDAGESYLDSKSLREDVTNINFNQFAPAKDFVSNKDAHHESNFNSPNETDIFTDSLETLVGAELNLSRKLDLYTHSDKVESNLYKKRNEPHLYLQNNTEFSKIETNTNLYRVKSESNMKNICIRNKSLTNFKSDSCLVDSSTEKSNEKSELTSLSSLSSNPTKNKSGQIMISGNSDLCRESDSEKNGYKRKYHENSYLKEDTHNETFHTYTPTPLIDNLISMNKNQSTNDFLHQNDGNSSKQQYLHKDKDTQRDAFNQQEVDNVMFPTRRNSYKRAVSNGTKDTTKANAKKHPKSLFWKRKPINSQQKSSCSLSYIKNLQEISSSKSDPSNMNFFVCSGLESMETSSLLNTAVRKRNTKKTKKTWIQCLCLGSKA